MPKPSTQRRNHDLWTQLMVLTAHLGLCVYCGKREADTLDHEQPVSGGGPDIWWNFVPACAPCNRRKNGRTAREWKRDMDLAYHFPKEFSTRPMPPEVYAGILTRVERAQREIQHDARRQWFRHHYGKQPKPRKKEELLDSLASCRKRLKTYPHPPWETPAVEGYSDICTRRICCGYYHPDAQHSIVFLSDEDWQEFQRRAFQGGHHQGDVLGVLVRRYLSSFKEEQPLHVDETP